jgi:Resolvase, N terminal domain
MNPKLTSDRLRRRAVIYIRQSSPGQVIHNHESQRRQYGLVDRARELGFRDVTVIDDDLGRSGSGLVERPGFQRLVAEVCSGEVGAVFCIEASRLARNGRDWHHLIELCGMVGAVVVDPDGIYDPAIINDRLLLGLNRPETQSTSHSTFCWTTSFGSVVPFRTRTLLAAVKTVPPADIPDVLTGETPTKGTAQAGTIERSGDFCIGAPRRHFVNLGNSFFWRF